MNLIRLHPGQPEGWALWPVLEARLARFAAEIDGQPPRPELIQFLRDCFANKPELLGAWLAIEGTEPVGHLVSWADAFFGEPFVFVYQVWTDDGVTAREVRAPFFQELRHWIDQMNWAYEQAHVTHRIRDVRFTTPRDPEVWRRTLRSLGTITKERTLITVRVDDVPVASTSKASALVPPPWIEPVAATPNGDR